MRETLASGINSTTPVSVLWVSPIAEDHTLLIAMLDRSERIPGANSKYFLHRCATVEGARAALSQAGVSIVLTERDLGRGSWRDILDSLRLAPHPPILIVTFRLADEYLWAEALNLGAYDVLAKPFDASEVTRVLGSAWRHWNDLHARIPVRNLQPMVATTAAKHVMDDIVITEDDLRRLEKQFGTAVRLMGSWNSDGTFGYLSVRVSSIRKAEDFANAAAIVDLCGLKHMPERTAAFIEMLHTFGPPLVAAIVAAYRECSPGSIKDSYRAAVPQGNRHRWSGQPPHRRIRSAVDAAAG